MTVLVFLVTLAQAEGAEPVGVPLPSLQPTGKSIDKLLFYDANIIGFDRRNQRSLFEGEVVVIGAGTMLSADKISVNQSKKYLEAEGSVVLLSGSEVFTGSRLRYFWSTTDLKIEQAVLVTEDAARISEVSDKVLGFSPEEVFFEKQRKNRLEYIGRKKVELWSRHAENAVFGELPSNDILDAYALLLEQEDLSKEIPNPALAKISAKRREAYEKRRKFWALSQNIGSGGLQKQGYFKIVGDHLQRTDGNDYRAINAEWTPCFCDDDEAPAWGFHAERIDAQAGGYLDFTDAILKIKGIPILYLPRLKIPLKGKRQSGFLFPTLRTGDYKLGTVYTQPVFFAFSDALDSTLTTDFFQEKGTRLGVETRYQISKKTGFSISVETMRDREWIESRGIRTTLKDSILDNYKNGSAPDGRAPVCADEWEGGSDALEACLDRNLAVPTNTWRGSQAWDGLFFLTPRVSLITDGEIRSDHRYIEDLQLVDSYEAAFSTNYFGNTYNTSEGQIYYSGDDWAASILISYGDNVLIADQRFTGLQISGQVDLQSRYYSLEWFDILPFPVYGAGQFSSIPITERQGARDLYSGYDFLGSGRWQRSAFDLVAPIKTEGIYTIDLFADAESRLIRQSGDGDAVNRIYSYKTGVTFRLPMDGMMTLKKNEDEGTRFLHHKMDWVLTFSSRPIVVRRGDYAGRFGKNGDPLVYFASDRKAISASDYGDVDSEVMIPHRRVRLSTSHRWLTFKEKWVTIPGEKVFTDDNELSRLSYRERAEREFMFAGDRPISNLGYMFTESRPPRVEPEKGFEVDTEVSETNSENTDASMPSYSWHNTRHRLQQMDSFEPANLDISIAYDYYQEKLRQEVVDSNRRLRESGADVSELVPYHQLPQAWIGPYLRLGFNWPPYTMFIEMDYNLYEKVIRSTTYTLGLPPFYGVQLGIGYSLSESPTLDDDTDRLIYKKTGVSSISLSTDIIPNISTQISYREIDVEDEQKWKYETQFGMSYLSQSGCWALKLLRSKLENQERKEASWLLQLDVVFLGQSRSGNLTPGVERELGNFSQGR